MNYVRIYDAIIQKRKAMPYEGYTETHHILPRSLGGSNSPDNLVKLSAREHFICHYLLVKIHPDGPNHYKMIRAFLMMLVCGDNQDRYVPSRKYQMLKEKHSEYLAIAYSGSGNSQFGTRWVSNPNTGVSMKLPKDSELPIGFMEGRNLKWKKCTSCEVDHMLSGALCLSCKVLFKSKYNTTPKKEKISKIPVKKTEKICPICTKTFKVPPHLADKKYCSLKCSTTNGNAAVARSVQDDNGIVFNTLTNAAAHHKVTVEAIRYRIKTGKYSYL
jgi:hypothetical protein